MSDIVQIHTKRFRKGAWYRPRKGSGKSRMFVDVRSSFHGFRCPGVEYVILMADGTKRTQRCDLSTWNGWAGEEITHDR